MDTSNRNTTSNYAVMANDVVSECRGTQSQDGMGIRQRCRRRCSPRCSLMFVCLCGVLLVFAGYLSNEQYVIAQDRQPALTGFTVDTGGGRNGSLVPEIREVAPVAIELSSALKKFSSAGKPSRKAKFTLILTYARSGSSWLGEITSHAPGTFYVYEPFFGMIKEGYYATGDVICHNNNTCRPASHGNVMETNQYVFEQLYNFFTCKINKLNRRIRLYKNIKGDAIKEVLKSCKQTRSKQCKKQLSAFCAKHTHRIIKVIRVSMELVRTMMELFPQLHVVHLMRDPRAVTNSRVRNKRIFKMASDTDSQTEDLCKRVDTDLHVFNELRTLYPGRLTAIRYEDLVADTQKQAGRIFKFLGLLMAPIVKTWIFNSTHGSPKANGYFGTSRADPEAVASEWRERLDYEEVQYIDKTCAGVYKQVGYLPITSKADLANFSVPYRSPYKYT